MEKLYIITKHIFAKDMKDAIRREKSARVDDVYVDKEWAKLHKVSTKSPR
jgi:hypothetical protein